VKHPTVKEAVLDFFRRHPAGFHATPARLHAGLTGVARYFYRENIARTMDKLVRTGELVKVAGCGYALARKAVAS
jgi:hypothetical protein